MLTITHHDNICVSATKQIKDCSVFKFRNGQEKTRPVISIENARIVKVDDTTVMIKLGSTNCIKKFLKLETRVRDMIEYRKMCSIKVHDKFGRMLECKLKDPLDLEDGFFDIELSLYSCKSTPRGTFLLWSVSRINETLKFVDEPFPETPTPSDSDEEDIGPPPEELEATRQDTISKLQTEIEKATISLNVYSKRISTFNNFLSLLNSPTESNPILEIITKASIALDAEC